MYYEFEWAVMFLELIAVYAVPWLVCRLLGWFGAGVTACASFILIASEIKYASDLNGCYSSDEAMLLLLWTVMNFIVIIAGVNGIKKRF